MLAKKGLKGPKLSPVLVNKSRALLATIIGRAVRDGHLTVNAVLDIKRQRQPKAKIDPLSFGEFERIVSKGLKDDAQSRHYVTVAFFCGARPSELFALKWSNVDLVKGQATIEVSHTKADKLHPTKTSNSERVIDLRPQALAALKAQRTLSRLKTDFVFCSDVGGALDRDNFNARVWKPALKRAGVRFRVPYQLRHSFVSNALASGESVGWVANQAGDSIETILGHYAHHFPNATRKDGSAFDKAAEAAGL